MVLPPYPTPIRPARWVGIVVMGVCLSNTLIIPPGAAGLVGMLNEISTAFLKMLGPSAVCSETADASGLPKKLLRIK